MRERREREKKKAGRPRGGGWGSKNFPSFQALPSFFFSSSKAGLLSLSPCFFFKLPTASLSLFSLSGAGTLQERQRKSALLCFLSLGAGGAFFFEAGMAPKQLTAANAAANAAALALAATGTPHGRVPKRQAPTPPGLRDLSEAVLWAQTVSRRGVGGERRGRRA